MYELVKEEDRAWHAGVSYWRGKESLNAHSIGIEIVNLGPITNKEVDITTPANSKDPAPPSNTNDEEKWNVFKEEQVEAVIKLCKIILQRHNIHPRDVVAHSDVAPTRKVIIIIIINICYYYHAERALRNRNKREKKTKRKFKRKRNTNAKNERTQKNNKKKKMKNEE